MFTQECRIIIQFLTERYLNICNNKSILLSCIPTYPAPPVTRIPVWFQQLTYYTTTYHLPSHGQTTNQQIIRFFRSKQTEWCFKLDQASWVIQPCHKRDSSRYRNIIIGIPWYLNVSNVVLFETTPPLIWWELETRKLIFEFRCVSSKSWQWTGIMSVAIARSERWMALQIVFDSEPSDLWR